MRPIVNAFDDQTSRKSLSAQNRVNSRLKGAP